ncbi:hypothetical protein [Culicoidibacter larvae]|uniref:Uncharacterized protein n=1 Tax=Culicoidibacter larvae TaxID=2579976 RepID=A0A5R8Q984_9FIRM|nr:hypothetical protein [Culicoidibacter larvae]TLG71168.1 hypothetical protein FEZ08_11480 [Culicoidibacter larvae]
MSDISIRTQRLKFTHEEYQALGQYQSATQVTELVVWMAAISKRLPEGMTLQEFLLTALEQIEQANEPSIAKPSNQVEPHITEPAVADEYAIFKIPQEEF